MLPENLSVQEAMHKRSLFGPIHGKMDSKLLISEAVAGHQKDSYKAKNMGTVSGMQTSIFLHS